MLTSKICGSSASTLLAISNHPFNRRLANGTLCPTVFDEFLKQESCYLPVYQAAMRSLAGRVGHKQHAAQLRNFSDDTVVWEQVVLTKLKARNFSEHASISPNSACQKYMAYLGEMSTTAEPAVAVAAFYPCFLIYADLGRDLSLALQNKDHPYYDWMTLYAGDDFSLAEKTYRAIVLDMAEEATDLTCEKMAEAFAQSTRHELSFFDALFPEVAEELFPAVSNVLRMG